MPIVALCRCILLTHWGRVTHICVSKLTIIGSDNGLSPERRQAIIWTSAGILLTGPLGTNFSGILIEILAFSLKKIRLKMSSAKCCSFRLGLNVWTVYVVTASWSIDHAKPLFLVVILAMVLTPMNLIFASIHNCTCYFWIILCPSHKQEWQRLLTHYFDQRHLNFHQVSWVESFVFPPKVKPLRW